MSSQAPQPLPPGTELLRRRYVIQRVLGKGGFGYVYLAEDTKEKRPVAIKQCMELEMEAVRQFGHEFAVLRMLAPKSKLFPLVYDEFTEPPPGAPPGAAEYVYGVMEFVPGRTLESVLEERLRNGQGPFGEPEVVAWMVQLLEALEIAHKADIIHRDVKPANIMLLPGDKQIKVIDVGIAKIGTAGVLTQRGALGVSTGYSPPEQYAARAGKTDRGTDVYAVGATMYALLTGTVPLEAPARINQQMDTPRQVNPRLNTQIESVILQAMDMDITRRFKSAAEMCAALQGKTSSVNCPHCGQANAATARFCLKCGGPMQAATLALAGKQISLPSELPAACDRAWADGASLLTSGKLSLWLRNLGPAGGPALAALQQIGSQYPNDPDLQLDSLLRYIQPQRPPPKLGLAPLQPVPVTVEQGTPHTTSFTISNSGHGILVATMKAAETWVAVKPASVHCRPGDSQTIQVVLDTTGLVGTRTGRPHPVEIQVQSNAGHAVVVFPLQVTAAPRLVVSPLSIDFGPVQHGSTVGQRTFQVSNEGVGLLAVSLEPTAAWLVVSPANGTLATGQRLTATARLTPRAVEEQGPQAAEIFVQAGSDGTATVKVTATVTGAFQVSCDPKANLREVKDLVVWCDSHWGDAIRLLQAGELYAAARYLGPPAAGLWGRRGQVNWPGVLNSLRYRAGQDPDLALEAALRALGAAAPEFEHNWPEVEAALGLGLKPSAQWLKLRKPPTQVDFRIQNCSRGVLHGSLQPLVRWLHVDQGEFRCLAGQEACISIRVDLPARRLTGWRVRLVDLHID